MTDVWGGKTMCTISATSALAVIVTGLSRRPNVWLVAMAGNVNLGVESQGPDKRSSMVILRGGNLDYTQVRGLSPGNRRIAGGTRLHRPVCEDLRCSALRTRWLRSVVGADVYWPWARQTRWLPLSDMPVCRVTCLTRGGGVACGFGRPAPRGFRGLN